MRKNLSNLSNVQCIDTEKIIGGKRYGLVNGRSKDNAATIRAFTKGVIVTKTKISDKITLYTNAHGDDICIEW
jgi:hypothetical protein